MKNLWKYSIILYAVTGWAILVFSNLPFLTFLGWCLVYAFVGALMESAYFDKYGESVWPWTGKKS